MTKVSNSKYKIIQSTRSSVNGSILLGSKHYNSLRNLKKDTKKRLRRGRRSADLLRTSTTKGEIAVRTKRKTRYGKILLIKQRLCNFYGGISDKFLRKVFKLSLNQKKNDPLSSFFYYLECRLLSVLIRSRFAGSSRIARQLLLHGQIKVNDKVVTRPGYLMKPGDTITTLSLLNSNKNLRKVYNNFKKYGSRRYKRSIFKKKSYLPLLKLPLYFELDISSPRLILVDYPNKKELLFPFPIKPKLLLTHYKIRNS